MRKTLLKLYSDNTLEFAGFGLGLIVALATELAGHDEISTLHLPFTNVPLFLSVLFPTLIFGAFMFFRSAFWGRVAEVAVTKQSEFHPKANENDIMKSMFDFHVDLAKKKGHDGQIVYKIGHANLWWPVLIAFLAFLSGRLRPIFTSGPRSPTLSKSLVTVQPTVYSCG